MKHRQPILDPLDDRDAGVCDCLSPGWALPFGDHVTIAGRIVDSFTTWLPNGEQWEPVFVGGKILVYHHETGAWRDIDGDDDGIMLGGARAYWMLRRRIMRLSAHPTLNRKGEAIPLLMNNATVEGVVARVLDMIMVTPRHPVLKPTQGVNLRDVFVQIKKGEIHPVEHKPEHGARWCINAPYVEMSQLDPELLGKTLWAKFFHGLWPDEKPHVKQARISTLGEVLFSACAGLGSRYHRVCLIQGEKGTGKSQFLDIASELVPNSAQACLPPAVWGDNFMGAELANKGLNLIHELPMTAIKNLEAIKSVVTGDLISRKPIYQAPIKFRCLAQHIFAANRLPSLSSPDDAFWDRWLLIPWEGPNFRDSKKGIHGIGKRIAKEEPGVLLAWILASGARLLQRGRYHLDEAHHQMLSDWQSSCDPVFAWVNDNGYTQSPAGSSAVTWPLLTDHWIQFMGWAKQGNFECGNKAGFRQRLKEIGFSVKRSNGTRVNLMKASCEKSSVSKDLSCDP